MSVTNFESITYELTPDELKHGHTFSIVSDIPTGVYEISMQESNEDQLTISLV